MSKLDKFPGYRKRVRDNVTTHEFPTMDSLQEKHNANAGHQKHLADLGEETLNRFSKHILDILKATPEELGMTPANASLYKARVLEQLHGVSKEVLNAISAIK